MSSPQEVTLSVVIKVLESAFGNLLDFVIRKFARVGRALTFHDVVIFWITAAEWAKNIGSPVKVYGLLGQI